MLATGAVDKELLQKTGSAGNVICSVKRQKRTRRLFLMGHLHAIFTHLCNCPEKCVHIIWLGVIPQSLSTWWPHCVFQVLNCQNQNTEGKKMSDPSKVNDVSKDVKRVL